MSQLPQASVLRIATAGSVDDGKSTLIGRLLYESAALLDDQLESILKQSKNRSPSGILDLSLVTDGLKSEREQGITIDVAYKYFSSSRRKYILADSPGHLQYTRNMVTAASRADVAIILVDATLGVLEQTRRHSYLIHLLGVEHVVLAINKIDRIGYQKEAIRAIERTFRSLEWNRTAPSLHAIPISALVGDNIKVKSEATPWYEGPSLLDYLDALELAIPREASFRLPVQWVGRKADGRRFAAGTLERGALRVGDPVQILPQQQQSQIAALWVRGQASLEAMAGDAVALELEDERDLERGQNLVATDALRRAFRHFEADLVWFDEEAWRTDERYILRCGSQTTRAQITRIAHRFDLQSLEASAADSLHVNDIARVEVSSARLIDAQPFSEDKAAGAFILIDPSSFRTVAAGLIRGTLEAADDRVGLGRLQLVEGPPPTSDVSRVVYLPAVFLSLQLPAVQSQLLETLLEQGWTVQLEKNAATERLRQTLTHYGWGRFQDGLGI